MTGPAVDSYTDAQLVGIVEHHAGSVMAAREAVRGALLELARVATSDADEVLTVPPEAWEPRYPVKRRKVERAMLGLENARVDLAAWARARDRQLARRDTASSASRQHYIDTGNYLDVGEAVDA